MARRIALALFLLVVSSPLAVQATPYASGFAVSGTDVSFILNEDADSLSYSVNGGAWQALSTTRGTKNITLGSPGDAFSIVAGKNDTIGYSIPTGGNQTATTNGLSQTTALSGFRLISSDANVLNKFNSPRGVSVSNNPDAPNFGSAYVSNSAVPTVPLPFPARPAVGDGLYALKADQSDAFGYGDTAQDPGNQFDGVSASANSPFRTFVAANGEVYVADFSDANANVYRLNPNMTSGNAVLTGIGGPSTVPGTQKHGSTTAAYVEGSSAGGNLVLYTLDEDLTTLTATGAGSNTDKNSLWRYTINGGAMPSSVVPTKINQANVLLTAATSDMERGADGKFYLAQFRSVGAEAGIVVLDANGATLFDSLTASRTLLGNPTANDIYRNVQGIAVSADQKWLAVMLNSSDVSVIPLVNGIPNLAGRLVVDSSNPDVASGRDIAFDVAGNIHYVSSGQALYRVLSPGGMTFAQTAFAGGDYSFAMLTAAVPEFAHLGLVAGAGMLATLFVRRKKNRKI